MPAQRVTISDLLLFSPDTTRSIPESQTLDSILPRAMATSAIDSRQPLGVFWETYGLASGDTATAALTVERERGGVLERLGRSLRIVNARSTVGVRFAFGSGRDAGALAVGQALRIALGDLDPGRYALTLRVSVPGQQPLVVRRRITVLQQSE
jgi:hypothetical protein